MTALMALTLMPTVKRFAYEVFLCGHRICAIAILAGLWVHVTDQRSLSRLLLLAATYSLVATSVLRYAAQLYRNIACRGWVAHTTKITGVTRAGDTAILRVQLARPCAIRPGQYFYLTILTSRLGSFFQRHPFAVAWWDVPEQESHPQTLYFVIEPQRGWTRSLLRHFPEMMSDIAPAALSHEHIGDDGNADGNYSCLQRAWLDGPFGTGPDVASYDTFILFASRGGVFAQLPLIKHLAEHSKLDPHATRKVVLAWEADTPHFPLKRWIQSILRDPGVRRDVSGCLSHASEHLAHVRVAARNAHLLPSRLVRETTAGRVGGRAEIEGRASKFR